MFWIRTWGVLVEIHDQFASLDAGLAGAQPYFSSAEIVAFHRWYTAILAAVHAVRAALSDQEVIYLEYRRTVECHLFQHAYKHRFGGDGALIEAITSKILSRHVTFDETDKAVAALLRHHRTEEAIAASVAAHTAAPLAEVAALVSAYARADERTLLLGPSKGR
jgi:hypothetical protein